MAKPKQQVQDNVPNLGKLTTEQLEGLAHDVLLTYGELNRQSKKTAAEKKELREKNLPILRTFRSRLSRRGSGEWQAWFEENKKDFGGVNVRTVNRWLNDKEKKPKFANLDNADGVSLAGKKYKIQVMVKGQAIHIELSPYVPYVQSAPAQTDADRIDSEMQPIAPTNGEIEKKERQVMEPTVKMTTELHQSKAAAELEETLKNTETTTVFEAEQNCDYSEQEVAAMFAKGDE